MQWVVESHALSHWRHWFCIGGSLGDLYGRRKIFAAGVVVFLAASAWCRLASTIGQLIVAEEACKNVGAGRWLFPAASL